MLFNVNLYHETKDVFTSHLNLVTLFSPHLDVPTIATDLSNVPAAGPYVASSERVPYCSATTVGLDPEEVSSSL